MSSQQVHHLYECLKKDIPYNPAQVDQFAQLEDPDLPEFLFHLDEEEDSLPCFAMTNPYEAIITHDPSRECVCMSPDMLQSFQPIQPDYSHPDPNIDILYPQESGKTNLSQMNLWSVMSDRPSYTIHPQPTGVSGSGCMDFSIDRLAQKILTMICPL